MKTQFITYFILAFGLTAYAQNTAIPDPHFEQALIDLGIDSDGEINGQVLTSDIEEVTKLHIENGFEISDVTGLQSFTSLDSLTITFTNINNLDLSGNTHLRYLNCSHNLLSELDLSNNTILEEVHCGNHHDDVSPQNTINYIDLTNNPNIKVVSAMNMIDLELEGINLMNGNNQPLMYINVERIAWEGNTRPAICIKVDDVTKANNGISPYDEWDVDGNYLYTDENCNLSQSQIAQEKITIYPNPASSTLFFDTNSAIQIHKAEIIDYTGKVVQTEKDVTENISVKGLATGTYILRLSTNKGFYPHKLIIR